LLKPNRDHVAKGDNIHDNDTGRLLHNSKVATENDLELPNPPVGGNHDKGRDCKGQVPFDVAEDPPVWISKSWLHVFLIARENKQTRKPNNLTT